MMRLLIDDIECCLLEQPKLPRYDAARLRNVEAWREGYDIEVSVAHTPQSDALFGDTGELYRTTEFNASYHTARLEADGVTLFEGMATLLGVRRDEALVGYRLLLRSGGEEWAKLAARTKIGDCGIEYSATMDMPTIERSWVGDEKVRFLPLVRDSYPEPVDTSPYATHRPLAPNDYYPFISVRAIIEELLMKSGYTLHSSFLNSRFFEKLHVSGAYRTIRNDSAYSAMGFKAYRTTSLTATADPTGRVSVWSPVGASNVGCIVDTVSPNAVDENGKLFGDAYASGGCFTFEEGYPVFRPKREVTAAFDYHLRFTTDYRIVSSRELRGFNRLRIGPTTVVDICLTNTHRDCRKQVTPGMSYSIMLFGDFSAEDTYFIPGFGTFREQSVRMTAASDFSGEAVLLYMPAGSTSYRPYTGDWALYEGFVSPTGSRTIELDVRSAFMHYTPTSPEEFNHIYFEGAEVGQSLTLHAGCSVKPVFGSSVGVGDSFTFKDIAQNDYSVAELLAALQQMFNLRIYSDKLSRRLYIEPYDAFIGGEEDLRSYQQGKEVLLDEAVTGCFERTVLGYQAGDGVLSRMTDDDEILGDWTFTVEGYAAKQGTRRITNPLFSPTASVCDVIDIAPSAQLLSVGDRDTVVEETNIAPRIVLYEGLVQLPDAERWDSASSTESYPLAYFFNEHKSDSLAFEPRARSEGLHCYHLTELREDAERQLLRCNLHLTPLEYAALFDAGDALPRLCARFRLEVDGSSSLFRLHSIERYDADSHIADCVFRRTLSD